MILHAAKNREIVEAKTKFNPMEMVSSKKSNSQKSNKIVEWFKKNF
jgi:hypothetical protein